MIAGQAKAKGDAGADLVLVGGGLANGLIALALRAARPSLRILMLEAQDRLGGEHTWSFFESDLDARGRALVAPLVAHRWPAYEVRFPAYTRRLLSPYASMDSTTLAAAVHAALGEGVRLNAPVARLEPGRAVLAGGEAVRGLAVIDGRGPGPGSTAGLDLGFQKFVGLELQLAAPHGLDAPVVMDATVDQRDGYRFIYALPFGPDRILVEDTRYADGPALDTADLRREALAYAAARGWRVEAVLREEAGVLPIALEGDLDALWAGSPLPRAGLRAALFHPTTGYSTLDAVRLALAVADAPDLSEPALRGLTEGLSRRLWARRGFYRLLNRMLFRACAPGQRYRVLERFYRLPEAVIRRFYAGETPWADRARILVGKPPAPVLAALACLPERRRASEPEAPHA